MKLINPTAKVLLDINLEAPEEQAPVRKQIQILREYIPTENLSRIFSVLVEQSSHGAEATRFFVVGLQVPYMNLGILREEALEAGLILTASFKAVQDEELQEFYFQEPQGVLADQTDDIVRNYDRFEITWKDSWKAHEDANLDELMLMAPFGLMYHVTLTGTPAAFQELLTQSSYLAKEKVALRGALPSV